MIRYCKLHEPPYSARWFEPATLASAIQAVKSGEADGITVDVQTGDRRTSYEIIPGRQGEVFNDEEVWFYYED